MSGSASALYVGELAHHRFTPVEHAFRVPLFYCYLDLAELPGVLRGRWFWSAERPAFAWFRRADHFGDPREPLAETVRACVQAQAGFRPEGPVRLLTLLRVLGVGMNPASFYYCFDRSGERLEAVLVEVHNTPWREKHAYVLDVRGRGPGPWRIDVPKAFHVSPFMDMDVTYHFRVGVPGDSLHVAIENHGDAGRFFVATLALRRKPLDGRNLAAVLRRFPLMPWTVLAGIYGQALRLWRKGVPLHPHPGAPDRSPRRRTA